MDLNCGIDCASGVYVVPDGTRNLSTISLPGTAVPGYRLFRPYGTGPARSDIVPFCRRTVLGINELTSILRCPLPAKQSDQSSVWARVFAGPANQETVCNCLPLDAIAPSRFC